VNIYLADLVISGEKKRKRQTGKYTIFIKEMKNPFSVKLTTIAPVSFGDSLRFLRSEEEMRDLLQSDIRFRIIECKANAQLHFVFKSVNQLYMFVLKLNLRCNKIEITSYEWNQLQEKYLRIHTNQLLAIEKQLIFHILQSLYIRSDQQRSYFFLFSPRKKADSAV